MKLKYSKSLLQVAAVVLSFTLHSCLSDLDVSPIDPSTTLEFDQNKVFTKIYSTLGLTGQQGPSGEGDIADIDEGTSSFYRVIWYANELTTDECIVNSWNDAGLPDLANCTWGASNVLVAGLYYRLTFDVTLCNFFLEQTAGATDAETTRQRAETRFIRALNYFYLMDLYGNVPFTEKVTTAYPEQIQRAALFAFLEKELIDNALPDLAEPRTNTYGRVDKAAAWLLLARIYLNAEVYTGTAQWLKAKEYSEKVIGSAYKLCPTYAHLFMADNGGSNDGSSVNEAAQEVILPVLQDGELTMGYGGSTFLIAGTHKDDMPNYGSTNNWAGPHCRQAMVSKFFPNQDAPLEAGADAMIAAAKDDRAMMYSIARTLSTNNNTSFTDGFSCVKYTNLRADGQSASTAAFADTDIPFMRLPEAYLTLAEASIRLNNGSSTPQAVEAFKALRLRAHAKEKDAYTLDDVLDEWAREFWFEGRRRMDLVRFNRYGGATDYNWDWKGGAKEGTVIAKFRNLLPIPTNDLNSNPNLVQNAGY